MLGFDKSSPDFERISLKVHMESVEEIGTTKPIQPRFRENSLESPHEIRRRNRNNKTIFSLSVDESKISLN